MKNRITAGLSAVLVVLVSGSASLASEKRIVSLRDFRNTELKSAGITVGRSVSLTVRGLGGGGGSGWMARGDGMFASGWIIDARTRSAVWEMNRGNTSGEENDDRSCEDEIRLKPGEYEVYFAAPTFAHRSWTKHIVINIDHRRDPLFDENGDDRWFFEGLWSDEIPEMWEERAEKWGIDLFVDESDQSAIGTFSPVRRQEHVVFDAVGLGDFEIVRQGVTVRSPVTLNLYAVGEERKGVDLVDFGWIVDTETRKPVWEMTLKNTHHAGGASKNIQFSGRVKLPRGNYVLYYITDDSHSMDDWNSFPPHDPLHWGLTVYAENSGTARQVDLYDYEELKNVIVSLTGIGDDEYRQEGFTLNEDTGVRVYAFGERGHGRRTLADYGYIVNARTREKVWTMDVDRCRHAGGATKNVSIDEVIILPRGSYLVTYSSDGSHSYDDWNAIPPFDQDLYGITVMGAGPDFDSDVVGEFVDPRQEGVIAQIVRVRDDADESKKFSLDRTARVRVHAMGEGQKRTMYDYGWIENRELGTVVWEMTYNMTFHAGGGRKNRMLNTTILLEQGEYLLRYVSDDSHAFNSWNTDPPDDKEYWGITLYEDVSDVDPVPPVSPTPPAPRSPGR